MFRRIYIYIYIMEEKRKGEYGNISNRSRITDEETKGENACKNATRVFRRTFWAEKDL